jgi:hypothetical protein
MRLKSKKFLTCLLLCMWCSLSGDTHSLVFVHLGKNVLPCLFTTIKQARYLNQECDIYLLTDKVAFDAFQKNHMEYLSKESIHLINLEEIPLTKEHKFFEEINKIDLSLFEGFWKYALERFFYLFDFMQYQNLENVVHLESDSMLYVDLKELMPIFEKLDTQIAAPFQSMVGCIPCFVFIKDSLSLNFLIHHILSEMKDYKGPRPHIDVNDMQLLASFYRKFGSSYMTPLPILMPEYSKFYPKRISTFEPDNQTDLDFLSMNAPLFEGFIFDAAALGVFANGNDRRYFQGREAGVIHYRSLFDPGHFSFFWQHDNKDRKVPALSFHGENYRIVNMHFHSKLPEGHTSFNKTQKEFLTQSHP